jgi:putative membrane protein
MTRNRITTLTALGAAFLLAACARGDNAESGSTTDSAAGAVNESATAPALSDAEIVGKLDAINVADSAHGRVASTKATSSDVKQYGQMMMGEHHALRVEGQKLATAQNITPAIPAGDNSVAQADEHLNTLNSTAKGAAWDKAYIDHEVMMHEQALQFAQQSAQSTQNAELRALLEKGTPVIQKHLDRAKQIQQSLAPTT